MDSQQATIYKINHNIALPSLEIKEGELKLCGFDLGTYCGFCAAPINIETGQIDDQRLLKCILHFKQAAFETTAAKLVKFSKCLDIFNPDVIFFEDIRFSPRWQDVRKFGRMFNSTEFLLSLRAILLNWAETNNILCFPINSRVIKKFATGNGKATKQEMIKAFNKKFRLSYKDTGHNDDVVDAVFLVYCGWSLYGSGIINYHRTRRNYERK